MYDEHNYMYILFVSTTQFPKPCYSIHASQHYCTFYSLYSCHHFIHVGTQWVGDIGSGIRQCTGLIAVITKNYLNSEYCTSELTLAKNSKKSIFPIIFEESVDFTQQPHAPGVQFIIHGLHWIYFRPGVDDYSQSLAKLVRGLIETGKQCIASTEVHLHLFVHTYGELAHTCTVYVHLHVSISYSVN